MFRKTAIIIYTFKWPILLGLLLVTLLFGMAGLRLQIDPSMETMFIKNSQEYRYYHEYNQKFGSDQLVVVAMATTDLFKKENLKLLQSLTAEIEGWDQVENVLSLSNAMDIRSKFIGIKIEPALKGALNGKRPMDEIKKEVLANELYQNNLISKDGKIANMVVYLKSSAADPSQNGILIEKLRDHLASKKQAGIEFYVAGSPVEQYDFIRLIRHDQFTFVPLITLLLIGTTFLIYRSFTCMLLCMSIVFMTLVWTLGSISLLGQQLNLMTSLLAPVIMIVSVVNSIYLINLFFEIRPHQASLKNTVAMTIEQLGVPSILTHFTAILGFASLAINPIPAIRSFGIFSALGTFYSYIVEVILTPILFPMLPYRYLGKPTEKKSLMDHILVEFIEKLDFRYKWWILILTVLTIFFSFKGISKIQVDTNIVKQMKPDLPLAVSTKFIDENLTGVYSLGFVLKRKNGQTFVDSEALIKLDEFKKFLEAQPEISNVLSLTTLIKKIHSAREDSMEAYKIPEKQEDLDRYFKGIMESKNKEVEKLISRDLREVRIEARMKAVGTTQGEKLEAMTRKYLKQNMSAAFDYELTGNVVLLGHMAKGLVHEQIHSFGFALVSIFLAIVLFFRSIRLALLAAIPNLIPILAVYGLMGYMHIELSTPTAMISSIVLGMVVDASIQFLYRFRLEFNRRHHYLQALHHTCRNMGQSMVVSTMILVAGFASSVFASFRPTVHFGLLTSLTIFLALICTLVILPVCLVILKPLGPQKLFSRKARPQKGEGDFSIHQTEE